MSSVIGNRGPTDEEKRESILSKLARFGPLPEKELEMIIPECNHWEVETMVRKMKKEGDVVEENGKLRVDTSSLPDVSEDQSALDGSPAEEDKMVERAVPRDVRTEAEMELELDEDQALLFEKMRTNVSRNCGYMSEEEFMEWVLREARRMTEV